MAGNLSDAGEALVRKWLFTDEAANRPTGWFLALYTAPPSDDGGGTELSGGGYSRQAISFEATGAANDADILFGPASADWGAVTHSGVFDETGRFLCWAALDLAKTIPSGDSLKFPAGAIAVAFD